MVDRNEVLDCVILLHQKGLDTVIWEDVTRVGLDAILEHVRDLNNQGKTIEKFSIERRVQLMDMVRNFGE